MERMELSTENIVDENVEKLAELFPEVVTEVREPDGTLRHTIDVEALKARVGDVAEGQRERYQFTWPGKREAKQEAYRQIDKCLRPCPEESVNWDTTQNLYIEGDNLDALKLLRNTYAGKIKMIYIDPPYNTGHDFIYDDDFSKTKADYDTENGDYDEEGGRLVANPESNGRFHSDWCSMMYPRLLLARDLLSEDGVVFISMDENEVGSLRKICDEVLGLSNFLNDIVWISNLKGRQISGAGAATCCEHILLYAREAGLAPALTGNVDKLKHVMPSTYKGLDYDVQHDEIGSFVIKNELYNSNSAFNEETRPTLVYLIFWNPKTGDVRTSETLSEEPPNGYVCIRPHRNSDGVHKYHAWRWSKEKVQTESYNLFFRVEGNDARVFTKVRAHANTSLKALASDISTSTGVKELERLFEKKGIFDYAKPSELIGLLIDSMNDRSAVVLDFFSGSATTAHAVMQLNAEDGGNRKFIMVQLPEVCDEKSEAAKAGYKNICEIGKERIRRAGKKIADDIAEANKQPKLGEEPKHVPDIGFRVLKIDSSNFEDVSAEPAEYTQQTLAGLADNLKPGRTAEDLLFQVMPQFQIPLSAKIEKRDVNGSTVFSVDDGRLAACFDRNVVTETIIAMAKLQPDYAVMRDASFTGDDAVSNFGELFKTYSPATITRVV